MVYLEKIAEEMLLLGDGSDSFHTPPFRLIRRQY
jgi:hypothetical protein